MAYKELIGHFSRVRAYMQHFYVYGFYTRDDFRDASPRAYDDERRRVEGWLGEYMGFRQTEEGKSVFLSFDSRDVRRDPLFRALKSKTFTERDITLHFLLLDILADGVPRTVPELMTALDAPDRLGGAKEMSLDPSTVRGKVSEYETLGLLVSEKDGKFKRYRRAEDVDLSALKEVLAFFAEAAPCGVIGSFLEDRLTDTDDSFRMKHHYITATLDSDVLCQLLDAIQQHRAVTLTRLGRRSKLPNAVTVVPLYILKSVQDGRSYLAVCNPAGMDFRHERLDRIESVQPAAEIPAYDGLRATYRTLRAHFWGTSGGKHRRVEHIEFTLRYDPWEQHIPRRLMRERRCGQVEELEPGRIRFTADVYDPIEMLPWIRSFTGRITDFCCTDPAVEARFRAGVAALYAQYFQEETP